MGKKDTIFKLCQSALASVKQRFSLAFFFRETLTDHVQLPASCLHTKGKSQRRQRKSFAVLKSFFLQFFPSQPLTLPQQCVGECLTPGFLNTKQHEAVSADFCAVNTPPWLTSRDCGRVEVGLGLDQLPPHTLTPAGRRRRLLAGLSAALSWPSRWELRSPLSFFRLF